MKDKKVQKIHEQKTRELIKIIMDKENVVSTLKLIVEEYYYLSIEECIAIEEDRLVSLKSKLEILIGKNE